MHEKGEFFEFRFSKSILGIGLIMFEIFEKLKMFEIFVTFLNYRIVKKNLLLIFLSRYNPIQIKQAQLKFLESALTNMP